MAMHAVPLSALLTQAVGSDGTALQAWILLALNKKRDGDGTLFQQLVEKIERNTDLVEQAVLVTCLSRCTASLQIRKNDEITLVVLQRCFRANTPLTAAVEAFAVNCVSVNADLLVSILHELVKHFVKYDLLAATPPKNEAEAAGRSARGVWRPEEAAEEAQIARDVHRVVQRVLETFPTGTMSFLDQLVQAYPHRVKRLPEQRAYLANILHVISYQPQLLTDILRNVTDRLIKIDVEVDPQKLEALHTGVIDVADDDEMFGLEVEETSEERQKMLENAEKLDYMMLILLQFFRSIFENKHVEAAEHDKFFEAVLVTFQATVFTTFRSKYSQFLIFYGCSYRSNYSSQLLQSLFRTAVAKDQPDTQRHSAVSYLGSFVARSKHLKLSIVEAALQMMKSWILEYMDKECPDAQGPDPNHHSLFYSLVQSLFYVLCFRLPQLMGAENGKFDTLKFDMRLDDIVRCALNPLKVIDQKIANKFMTLAVKHKFITWKVLRPLLEHNKTIVVNGLQEFEDEHTFFPFDKYNLPHSRHFIDPIYQGWEEVSTISDDIFSEDDVASAGGWPGEGSEGAEESIAMSLTSQLSLRCERVRIGVFFFLGVAEQSVDV